MRAGRGAPHNGLAGLIRRIRSRISAFVLGRPQREGDELKLQRCAAVNTEREQGNESGQNRDHAPDCMAGVQENPQSFSTVLSFEQRQLLITENLWLQLQRGARGACATPSDNFWTHTTVRYGRVYGGSRSSLTRAK